MTDLNLKLDEGVILQNMAVIHNDNNLKNGELYLTNQNIIFIRKTITGKIKTELRIPLNDIKTINGKTQAIIGKTKIGNQQLQLFLKTGQECFTFINKPEKETKIWVDKINTACKKIQKNNNSNSECNDIIIETNNSTTEIVKEKQEKSVLFNLKETENILISKVKKSPIKILLAILFTAILLISLGNSDNGYKKIKWEEDIVMSEVLPIPNQKKGKLEINTEKNLLLKIKNVNDEDFAEYINNCKESGFTIEPENNEGYFSAYTAQGYKICVTYDEQTKIISVEIEKEMDLESINLEECILYKLIPDIDSSKGLIEQNDEQKFTSYIKGINLEDFNKYIDECIKLGFSKNTQRDEYYFHAKNQEFNPLEIKYLGNSLIHISIEEPIYNVNLTLKSINNLVFSTYDINVYIDDVFEGTIKNGESTEFEKEMNKGYHTLKIVSDDYKEIEAVIKLDINSTSNLNYDLYSYNDTIRIKALDKTTKESTIPTTTNISTDNTELNLYVGEESSVNFKIESQGDWNYKNFDVVLNGDKTIEVEHNEDDYYCKFNILCYGEGKTVFYLQSKDGTVKSNEVTITAKQVISEITFSQTDDIQINMAEEEQTTGYFDVNTGNSEEIKYSVFEGISEDENIISVDIENNDSYYSDFKYIITPLKTGETYFYIQTKDKSISSEKIKVIVTEQEIITTSITEKASSGITVYTTPTGKKYHYSKSCAGKNAIENDLNDVKDLWDPCGKCAS